MRRYLPILGALAPVPGSIPSHAAEATVTEAELMTAAVSLYRHNPDGWHMRLVEPSVPPTK